ncbi:N-6 DNA methylase [Kineococcus rhizosphaerae]|uniref:site-specific DNA-methyltransferase (adenine-specific) n=1 Tax=Kineococcus rhizosphaerae TaxID=559628 RepID=A0A2T0QTM6_9ACTN|nr:N-6 DNA methylase [Kineococcus rhizosphaerae]
MTAAFGAAAKAKLTAAAITGQPEDQLRGPLEAYLTALGEMSGVVSAPDTLVFVGESALKQLQVRPDFAVLRDGVLVGFIEVKAPGKGADPRHFTDKHDRDQWAKLQALPNLMYTDGNEFTLWNSGEQVGSVQRLKGDIEVAGNKLTAPSELLGLMASFLTWKPYAPSSPAQLAQTAARLCRLLRDEVAEQLAVSHPVLTGLAKDWRHLLFPDASDKEFADSYAQAVTFGLLMARVRNIDLDEGVGAAAAKLAAQQHSLVGTALRILTDGQLADDALATSVATLTRTLSVVDWPKLSKGNADAWLFFYEDFLAVYDPELRKATGSYYTPVEVVRSMTGMVDEALTSNFGLTGGLADPSVTVLDPALGTGTYLLEVVRRIAERVEADQGAGAVPGALAATVNRIVGFELQIGPFAVAQLRLLAELTEMAVPQAAQEHLRTYVTNTLADPLVEEATLGTWYEPIAQSRRAANKIKADEPVMVVLGNPPYKDKSRGKGGFVESGAAGRPAPLTRFMPDAALGVGAHVKHLYNPYVYFWRWATEKVFDQHALEDKGIVCFITVAGFLGGPGFAGMRSYLRDRADSIYVIDCSPEGHQPAVSTRIFQGVMQPVCIVMAVRDGSTAPGTAAAVHYRQLAAGPRQQKFQELQNLSLHDTDWLLASTAAAAPFWPQAGEDWSAHPSLADLLLYSGSGSMLGRTWPIAPDKETLERRWKALVAAPTDRKPELLQEHPTDRRVDTELSDNLPGYPAPVTSIGSETGASAPPVRYGYRSFDRQWVIPDKRVMNRPNPMLWRIHGPQQVFLTALDLHSPQGPAATFSALVPDLHHYQGSFGGRAWPLWLDDNGSIPNVPPKLLSTLSDRIGVTVTPMVWMAYLAGVLSHPDYSQRFEKHLAAPGLRVPIAADTATFQRAAALGAQVLWLHSYGTRYVDPKAGRPAGAPRVTPATDAPKVMGGHPMPADGDDMPDTLKYDPSGQVLKVGAGWVSNVLPGVWDYSVGGKRILTQWFSYRKADRERPQMGSRRNSPLSLLQPDHWLPEYTQDLIDLLNVLTLLEQVHPQQQAVLTDILAGPLVTVADLTVAGVFPVDEQVRKAAKRPQSGSTIPSDPDTLFG